MSSKETLLEKITRIIERDVEKIERLGKQDGALDRTSAGNLVDYAKVALSVDRHERQLEEQAAKAKINESEYAQLRAKAEAIIKAQAGKQ